MLAGVQHELAVDDHVLDADAVLERVGVGRAVDHAPASRPAMVSQATAEILPARNGDP
jgi:hypothetical protein